MIDLVLFPLAFAIGIGVGIALARNGLNQMLREAAIGRKQLEFGGRIYTIIREQP